MLLDETKQWDRHETEISIFCQQADRESAGDRAAHHAFYAGDDFHRSLPKYEGRDPWPLSEYEERVEDVLRRSKDKGLTEAAGYVDRMIGEVAAFVKEAPQADDLTMLAIRYIKDKTLL